MLIRNCQDLENIFLKDIQFYFALIPYLGIKFTEENFHASWHLSVQDNEQKYCTTENELQIIHFLKFNWNSSSYISFLWIWSLSFSVNSECPDKNQVSDPCSVPCLSHEGNAILCDAIRLRSWHVYLITLKIKHVLILPLVILSLSSLRNMNIGSPTYIWKWLCQCSGCGKLRFFYLFLQIFLKIFIFYS